MNKKSCIKNKWAIKIKSMLAFGILFSIYVSVGSATIEMSNIEQGDGIWGTINVDTTGLVSVNAWSDDSSDDIWLGIYNQTGHQVASSFGGNGQTTIDYLAATTGIYKIKIILTTDYHGGTSKISASSNKQISLTPKNIFNMSNIEQGDGIWGTINVDTTGLVSVNAWSDDSSDDIWLGIYNQTGHQVASSFGGNGQTTIDYLAATTGTYKIKVILTTDYHGWTSKISASSNKKLFLMQKNIRRAFGVAQGQAIFYDLSLQADELLFINEWSDDGSDDIWLGIYNQTGHQVASNFGGNGQTLIDYIVPTAGTYTIKAVLTTDYHGGTSMISLSTNENFNGITVISPNGGENWTRGNTMAINWSSHGSSGANVSIELLKDGVPNIINSSTPNDGSYNWAIPFSQIPGSDYKIRVTSTTNSAFYDTSDNNFTISDPAPKTGDINGNGQLTLVDAIYLAKHVGGFNGYEVIYADGDINCDGKVTLVDALYMAKHIGGFIGYEKLYCAIIDPI